MPVPESDLGYVCGVEEAIVFMFATEEGRFPIPEETCDERSELEPLSYSDTIVKGVAELVR